MNEIDPFDVGWPDFEEGPRPVDLNIRIPWGKHAGEKIKDLPIGYVNWLLDKATSDWVEDNRESLVAALTYVDESKIAPYVLAPDQAQSADEICYVLFDKGAHLARLQGGAGYGKSFTVQEIAIRAKRAGYQVRAAATSYVATNNLMQDLDPIGVDTRTIASMLSLEVTYNGPKEIYQPGPQTLVILPDILSHGCLLIIDEYSMVDDVIGRTLIEAAAKYGGKLLVVGDVYQLPSPAQNWDSLLCSVEPYSTLVTPKRYGADTELFAIEQLVRHNPWLFKAENFLGDMVSRVNSLDGLIDAYIQSYNENPDDQHLMVYYRRADMVAANKKIRTRLFGEDAHAVCPGEQLRIQRTADFTPYYGGDGERVYSGTTIQVVDVEETVETISVYEANLHFQIPVYKVTTGKGDRYPVIFSVTEHQAQTDMRGGAEFNAALQQLSEWCDMNHSWTPYRNFRNCLVQVAYQYASTVHRTQGQSVDRVFTCPAAMWQTDPYTARKLLYVALTRAKRKLTVL